jgi:two-component system, chemotaxis family, protein-glutamate methylesterase/glutaminase
MPAIRVLVVDDSALVRQMVTHVLAEVPRIEVVGTARDGVEALTLARELKPDVITLDIQMPKMDGLAALPHLVRDTNARVVMLSSVSDPETTYQALELGAVDFVGKPAQGLATALDELAKELVRAIRTAARISPAKRHVIASPPSAVPGASAADGDPDRLVVIAASTGGPLALERVFAGLRPDPHTAYLIVQHLPPGFAASLGARLGRAGGLPIVEAEDGTRLRAGHGYVAPYGSHMMVEGRPGRHTRIVLSEGPHIHGLRPSADPLFESAASEYGSRTTGVVLTGMGSDGAHGLLAIRKMGGRTIVQDEETSVVWGMPGAAVRLGAAAIVVPLDGIAAEIAAGTKEARRQ